MSLNFYFLFILVRNNLQTFCKNSTNSCWNNFDILKRDFSNNSDKGEIYKRGVCKIHFIRVNNPVIKLYPTRTKYKIGLRMLCRFLCKPWTTTSKFPIKFKQRIDDKRKLAFLKQRRKKSFNWRWSAIKMSSI